MFDEVTIGARLRVLRRWRGMTLAQLAGQADLSVSFLSMVERGQRALDRRSHIAAVAAALKVSETELTGGPHLTTDPLQADPHTYIPALRVALETNSLHDAMVESARPLSELAALMSGPIAPLRQACEYVGLGKLLPDLIDELYLHIVQPADEAAQRLALETLVEAAICAATTAKHLNYPDLAYIAALRADDAAARLDDPVQRGKAAFALVLNAPRTGSWNRVKVMAERSADRLQPHATKPLGAQVLGMTILNAALASAATNDVAGARDWLDEAAELARRMPDDLTSSWQGFSATNVKVWEITVGVECGEAGSSLRVKSDAVEETKLDGYGSRKAGYLADVGRGLARDPKTRGDAVQWLRRAENVAPQRIRNSAPVRETVAVLLEQAKAAAGGRELRGMASRMGVPH
ncbi:MAG: helix-turn-helix domain-containing protein [Actinomadura sp.]